MTSFRSARTSRRIEEPRGTPQHEQAPRLWTPEQSKPHHKVQTRNKRKYIGDASIDSFPSKRKYNQSRKQSRKRNWQRVPQDWDNSPERVPRDLDPTDLSHEVNRSVRELSSPRGFDRTGPLKPYDRFIERTRGYCEDWDTPLSNMNDPRASNVSNAPPERRDENASWRESQMSAWRPQRDIDDRQMHGERSGESRRGGDASLGDHDMQTPWRLKPRRDMSPILETPQRQRERSVAPLHEQQGPEIENRGGRRHNAVRGRGSGRERTDAPHGANSGFDGHFREDVSDEPCEANGSSGEYHKAHTSGRPQHACDDADKPAGHSGAKAADGRYDETGARSSSSLEWQAGTEELDASAVQPRDKSVSPELVQNKQGADAVPSEVLDNNSGYLELPENSECRILSVFARVCMILKNVPVARHKFISLHRLPARTSRNLDINAKRFWSFVTQKLRDDTVMPELDMKGRLESIDPHISSKNSAFVSDHSLQEWFTSALYSFAVCVTKWRRGRDASYEQFVREVTGGGKLCGLSKRVIILFTVSDFGGREEDGLFYEHAMMTLPEAAVRELEQGEGSRQEKNLRLEVDEGLGGNAHEARSTEIEMGTECEDTPDEGQHRHKADEERIGDCEDARGKGTGATGELADKVARHDKSVFNSESLTPLDDVNGVQGGDLAPIGTSQNEEVERGAPTDAVADQDDAVRKIFEENVGNVEAGVHTDAEPDQDVCNDEMLCVITDEAQDDANDEETLEIASEHDAAMTPVAHESTPRCGALDEGRQGERDDASSRDKDSSDGANRRDKPASDQDIHMSEDDVPLIEWVKSKQAEQRRKHIAIADGWMEREGVPPADGSTCNASATQGAEHSRGGTRRVENEHEAEVCETDAGDTDVGGSFAGDVGSTACRYAFVSMSQGEDVGSDRQIVSCAPVSFGQEDDLSEFLATPVRSEKQGDEAALQPGLSTSLSRLSDAIEKGISFCVQEQEKELALAQSSVAVKCDAMDEKKSMWGECRLRAEMMDVMLRLDSQYEEAKRKKSDNGGVLVNVARNNWEWARDTYDRVFGKG